MVKDLNTLSCQKPNSLSLRIFLEIIQHLAYFDIIVFINMMRSLLMVKVEFLGPIPKEALEVEISNLSELATLLQEDEALASWLENSAVAINDTLVASLDVALKDGDRVSLLPPVCGG
jgi:molybdopterin synthase sulfur carrier subunit